MPRTCGSCKIEFDKTLYSKNQWIKGPGVSQCKTCVNPPAGQGIGFSELLQDYPYSPTHDYAQDPVSFLGLWI